MELDLFLIFIIISLIPLFLFNDFRNNNKKYEEVRITLSSRDFLKVILMLFTSFHLLSLLFLYAETEFSNTFLFINIGFLAVMYIFSLIFRIFKVDNK